MTPTRLDESTWQDRSRRLTELGDDFLQLMHNDVLVFLGVTLYLRGDRTLEECLVSMLICVARERDQWRPKPWVPSVLPPEYVI